MNYLYNAFDTRVQAGTTNYLRSGPDVTDPLLSDGLATYTPGISQSRNGTSTFDLQDRLGSATYQTNTAGTVTGTRTYDPFGSPQSNLGAQGPLGFAGNYGYQEDTDNGLKLLGHRYYDPSTGRFLSRDPFRDGENWYVYSANCPLVNLDPNGYSLEPIVHYLYYLVDEAGNLLKWGVTKNLGSRYGSKKMKEMAAKELMPAASSLKRFHMLEQERMMVGRNPGPWNKEKWAGKIKDAPYREIGGIVDRTPVSLAMDLGHLLAKWVESWAAPVRRKFRSRGYVHDED